ncbi:MAG: YwqG family protein [Anaerovoracaceae bacterium]
MGLFSIFKKKQEPASSKPAGIDKDSAGDLLRAIEKKAIAFSPKETGGPIVIGVSKIGGKPHLPEGFRWPYFEGTNYDNVRARRPLSFMAQINLADVADLDADSELPHSGFLYFFYELDTMRWGFDPEDEGCARVFYYDVTADALSIIDYPDDLNPGYYVPESAIAFNRARSIPSFEEFGNSVSVDCDDYMQAAEENGIDTERSPESIFKLLGYADLIQGSILWECAMSESSLSSDAWKTLSEDKKSEVYAKESKWTLLSQFGTISDSIMFGDCGCIYYYIRKEDLEKRCFDNIHLSLQCY